MGNTGHGETFLFRISCIGSAVFVSWNESGVAS